MERTIFAEDSGNSGCFESIFEVFAEIPPVSPLNNNNRFTVFGVGAPKCMSNHLCHLLIFFSYWANLLIFDLRSESSLFHRETLVEMFFDFKGQLASEVTIMTSLINWVTISKLFNVWNLDGALFGMALRSVL